MTRQYCCDSVEELIEFSPLDFYVGPIHCHHPLVSFEKALVFSPEYSEIIKTYLQERKYPFTRYECRIPNPIPQDLQNIDDFPFFKKKLG